MQRLRVLLMNAMLDQPSGTTLYVYDVARQLLARGHQPIVYSPRLGEVAERLSQATISVVSDLEQIAAAPDVIHCQHTQTALTALLHFSQVPAIYVCHDWNWSCDTPPQLPRIHRYIAVDHTVRERLLIREAICPSLVSVIFNGVDLARFQPRAPLPVRPQRALAISNYLEPAQAAILHAACQRQAIALDVRGAKLSQRCERPEAELPHYDLVFAKGRCAWEALAVGAAVIVCDTWGLGPLVTSVRLPALREANFGRRLLQQPLAVENVAREIDQYDAADATHVSQQIRATGSLEQMVEQLLASYADAIAASRQSPPDQAADMRAAARFLAHWPDLDSEKANQPSSPEWLPTLGETLVRRVVRDELARTRRQTGFRKLWHSLTKRLIRQTDRRRAA